MKITEHFVENILKALESCKAERTRDGYGTPYTHYYFDEKLIEDAKVLCKDLDKRLFL